ncbi:ATP-binding protein [Flindersiella endophytica]
MSDLEQVRGTGGLPAELTRLVGRAAELTEVGAALSTSRLVTLIGIGGVGKTRVAMRTARERMHEFPDGVCFVGLSALRDPDLLPNAVSAALELPESSDQTGASQLKAMLSYLNGKRILIVLDTCEHLIDACARFAQTVLEHCPDVRILATSRQPLGAPGEQLLQILPLAVADPDEDPGPASEPTDAMVLFAERAEAVVSGFRLTDANRADVARLCHRLDGIPLAIELAVVRLRALPLSGLLERLDNRFRLLTGGSRTAAPRHHTLRTAIDWSYQLCAPAEQLLWTRLSVFAGEFELTAAEEICSSDDLPADEILEHLIGLVDKAIVLRVDDETGACYRMLDTIREYGLELLEQHGEVHTFRARHRDYYLALARAFAPEWLSRKQLAWLRRLSRELASVRSALEFCSTSDGEAPLGMEMAACLWGLWLGMGRVVEGHYWLDRLLELCHQPSSARMRALYACGHLHLMSGQHDLGTALNEEAAELAEEYGDRSALAYITFVRGLRYTLTSEPGQAVDQLGDASRQFAAIGDLGGEAWAEATICGALSVSAKYDEMLAASEHADALLRANGDRWTLGWFTWIRACALWGLGRFDESEADLRTAMVISFEINHLQALGFSFETMGWIASAQGQYDQAAAHLGTAAKVWEKFSEPRLNIATMHQAHDDAVAMAKARLGGTRFQAQFAKGAALPLRVAVAQAIEQGERRRRASGQQLTGWAALTRREQEVAVLVADGMSNRQIAERLVVSKRTIDSHIEHILGKLTYSSRAQIASLAVAQGPESAEPPSGAPATPASSVNPAT